MRNALVNCRIVSPGIDIPEGFLLFDDRTITAVGQGKFTGKADRLTDASGLIAAPGFIDIHSHGRSGADFCDALPETFPVIGRGKCADGVTGFLATGLTVSADDLRRMCRAAAEYRKNTVGGATLLGVHLEGPFFHPAYIGAQNPAHLKDPDTALVDELNAICPVRKVSFSPELPGAEAFTAALAARHIMPSGGHSGADAAVFERLRALGMKHLTHFCNVMSPLHHLRFGMVGAGLLDDDVYVEMICDGVHLCDEMIRLIAKVKGPDRMMLISDAMRAAAMPDGEYTLGGQAVTVTGGRAVLSGSNVVAGSTMRFFSGLQRLVRLTGMPLSDAVRTTAWNQAESLGIPRRGKLEEGFFADIVLLDDSLTPRATFCEGSLTFDGRQTAAAPHGTTA